MSKEDDRSGAPSQERKGKADRPEDDRQRRLAQALRRNLRRRKGASSDVATERVAGDDRTQE